MKIKTSRLYYFHLYLIFGLLILIFPHFLTLTLFLFVIILVEIEIISNFGKLEKNEITIYRGIIFREITKINIKDINEVKLEKNPLLSMFGLSNLRIKVFGSEYLLKGIKNGEKIFEKISQIKSRESK